MQYGAMQVLPTDRKASVEKIRVKMLLPNSEKVRSRSAGTVNLNRVLGFRGWRVSP